MHRALATTLAALALAASPGARGEPEVRAFWVDAFHEGIHSRAEVDLLLQRVRSAGCNAVFVQVRKGGDAYYQSRYDPWAVDNPERFDALAYLCERARAAEPRIAVHAWLNACAVGRTRGSPYHIAALHPDWLSISNKGATHDGEATKIDPGHPDAADWTVRTYLDVLRHYPVDGVHLDFIRYGGKEWGYSPRSVERFHAMLRRRGERVTQALPDPDDTRWKQWRRDQVTAIVRKVAAMGAAVRPDAAVSAATITWGKGPESDREYREKSAAMQRAFQDWVAWMREGILDLNCLMAYYRESKHGLWFRQWTDFAKDRQYRRWAVLGAGIWLNPIPDSLRQIERLRKPTARGNRCAGVLLYSYAGTDSTPDGKERQHSEELYAALANPSPHGAPPFARPAEHPRPPWKARAAHVMGFVVAGDALAPVDGAEVTLVGRTWRRQVTDGTGFFAFVDVPAGDRPTGWTVRVRAKWLAPRDTRVRVQAGACAQVTLALAGGAVETLGRLADATPERAGRRVGWDRLTVVGGSDHFPGTLLVAEPAGGPAMRVRLAAEPPMAFQAGDEVAVRGTLAVEDGERLVRDAVARLVGVAMPQEPREVGENELAEGPQAPLVRLRGVARNSGADRFVLQVNGAPVEVMLLGTKGPGVEDLPAPLAPPPEGARGEAVGVLTAVDGDGQGRRWRLRPRTQDDLRFEPPADLGPVGKVVAGLVPALFRRRLVVEGAPPAYARARRLARGLLKSGRPPDRPRRPGARSAFDIAMLPSRTRQESGGRSRMEPCRVSSMREGRTGRWRPTA